MVKSRNKNQTIEFNDRLVLFNFLLSSFGAKHLQDFSYLNKASYEGFDENGNTLFYRELEHRPKISAFHVSRYIAPYKLKIYDENICRHLKQISQKRGNVKLKYFQYLSLLFIEYFLDRFFNDKDEFVNDLNLFLRNYRSSLYTTTNCMLNMDVFAPEKLNKLCFMCATGSGKTLIMHINILQFQHYNKQAHYHYNDININKTILLSPNEGMSLQHLDEFKKSNIPAYLFQKNESGLDFYKDYILIIDMNKLKEEGKVKTVSVDSFEQNNLVLIDEAHRGLQGDVWSDYRTRLSAEGGFSFEYSATFKQALRSLSPTKKEQEAQLNDYGKSIVIDYSYKYFYSDGYGKDYRIYNLHEGLDGEEQRSIYLTGCILSFFQQAKLYNVYNDQYKIFEIENPLMVFVGNRVTTPIRSSSSLDAGEKELLTDIQEILVFINNFVSDKEKTLKRIKKVLEAKTNIVDNRNSDIFSQNFEPLFNIYGSKPEPEAVYSDLLRTVFNTDTQSDNPRLYLIDIKSQGEIGLRIGTAADFFGVINIGDTTVLIKQCEIKGLVTAADEFSTPSLFRKINEYNSNIKVLIGSRKFTEGWNCWRVSTMGLINFAKGEGSQAIQLFGRGVRLHGYENRLKRSGKADDPPPKPPDIAYLETLTIFGVKADYMAKFKEYLEIEGLPPNAQPHIYKLATVNRFDIAQNSKLKVLKVKEGINFTKQAARFLLDVPIDQNCKDYFIRNKIRLDCRAKVQGIASPDSFKFDYSGSDKLYKIPEKYLSYIDYEYIYFQLLRYKSEKKYYNICIDLKLLPEIMKNSNWEYGILIPEDELKLNSLEKANKATSYIALVLQSYMDKYYTYHKNKWEAPYLEYQDLSPQDENFVAEYIFTYTPEFETDTNYLQLEKYVNDLSALLRKDKAILKKEMELFSNNLISFDFEKHLYAPLVYKSDKLTTVQITPVSLNYDEKNFVDKLSGYLNENKGLFKNIDIFLLRNKSKSGIGFFEAGNFYPDYILWIDAKDRQYMTFIDPKGLIHHNPGDPKIKFYQTIKELEKRPLLQATKGDKDIILNSFIVSGSSFPEIKNKWSVIDPLFSDITGFSNNHVVFLDHDDCIKTMFDKLLGI